MRLGRAAQGRRRDIPAKDVGPAGCKFAHVGRPDPGRFPIEFMFYLVVLIMQGFQPKNNLWKTESFSHFFSKKIRFSAGW